MFIFYDFFTRAERSQLAGHLELLSGKFTFYKDRRSQLWLVDATESQLNRVEIPHRVDVGVNGLLRDCLG